MGSSILFYLVASLGIGFILFQMIKFLLDLRNSRSKINKDIESFRSELKDGISHLAPWDHESLELLSTNHENVKRSKNIDTSVVGDITNIFHEPLVSYSYKKYFAPNRKSILVARTSNDEFIYKAEKDFIYLFINEQKIGYFDKFNNLTQMSNRKIAQMELNGDLSLLPITMQDKSIAGYNNKPTGDAVNNRALQLYNHKFTPEDTQIVLSFALKELILDEA